MNEHYKDIRSRLAEPPKWFDEHAVPRYCPFRPTRTANIYCDEAVLAVITCQGCGTPFRVAFSQDRVTAHGDAKLANDSPRP